jgi:hypothetical protein
MTAETRLSKFLTDQQEAVGIARDLIDAPRDPYAVRSDALNMALYLHKERESTMAEAIEDAKKVEAYLRGSDGR